MANSQIWQVNALGMRQINNIRLNTYTAELPMFCLSMNWASADPWGTWFFKSIHNTATRTISATKNTNIIITPKSVSCKRFSRLDDVYDWTNCVDPDTTTFKKLTDSNTTSNLSDFLGSFKAELCSGYGLAVKTNLTGTFKAGKSGGNSVYYWDGSSGSSGSRNKPTGWDTNNSWIPYFGFCNYYTDYNQLYIKDYDNIVSDLKVAHSDLNVIKDADSVEHLALNAGAPVVEAKKDEKVCFDITFADLTKDYDMWFKVGSFSYNKNPDADINLIKSANIKYIEKLGSVDVEKPIVAGAAANSFKVPNGKCRVQITMPSDGYIFTKWQYSSTSIEGGGTYKPSRDIEILTPVI